METRREEATSSEALSCEHRVPPGAVKSDLTCKPGGPNQRRPLGSAQMCQDPQVSRPAPSPLHSGSNRLARTPLPGAQGCASALTWARCSASPCTQASLLFKHLTQPTPVLFPGFCLSCSTNESSAVCLGTRPEHLLSGKLAGTGVAKPKVPQHSVAAGTGAPSSKCLTEASIKSHH